MIEYSLKPYEDLSTDQLYDIMVLRQEVFVVEQDCPYLDADGRDQGSHHVLGYQKGHLMSYARICAPTVSYPDYASIGRVVTSLDIRGTGEGRKLMLYALEKCRELYPDHDNKISAQYHLRGFYGSLGYKVTGDQYLEDNIPHIAMIRSKDHL